MRHSTDKNHANIFFFMTYSSELKKGELYSEHDRMLLIFAKASQKVQKELDKHAPLKLKKLLVIQARQVYPVS